MMSATDSAKWKPGSIRAGFAESKIAAQARGPKFSETAAGDIVSSLWDLSSGHTQ